MLEQISRTVQIGNAKLVKELVKQALEDGLSPADIMNDGLIAAMAVVGDDFKNNRIFVPEMLVASRAMSQGLKILEPHLVAAGVKPIGTVVIGTVKQDLHDIGKNLVATMMRGVGATVCDLGVDVPDEIFVKKAEEIDADIVAISALLTTTMPAIGDVIKAFETAAVRDKYKIMIGGAPVNSNFAKTVGADYYSPNAAEAAELVREILSGMQVH
ncbi:MAG: corrinoid protein [Candidatus Accumulibacter sp.]|jgi:5-methyltetrahydrofolate--homocysteine methyltransferase|nr:corrinoid protein [Accumulibacter sp.]